MSKIQDILNSLRREYSMLELDEKSVMKNPFKQFEFWMEQAIEAKLDDLNAMSLATADAKGKPDVRVVLLKSFDSNGFVFYTNYKSEKAKQIEKNKYAALNFFWVDLQRQVRINGTLKKTSAAESDEYFATRPRESQLGAWASTQSAVIKNRQVLDDRFLYYFEKYKGSDVPRPPQWGGYILKPSRIEFWQGRENRLHDRILFERNKEDWKISRLSP
jgi:pyridoxamine 5'-phosphate oxidase